MHTLNTAYCLKACAPEMRVTMGYGSEGNGVWRVRQGGGTASC